MKNSYLEKYRPYDFKCEEVLQHKALPDQTEQHNDEQRKVLANYQQQ